MKQSARIAAYGLLRKLSQMPDSRPCGSITWARVTPGEIDPQADQLEVWTRDALAAAQELRRRSGVTQICFLGVRLGALLATLAAPIQNGKLSRSNFAHPERPSVSARVANNSHGSIGRQSRAPMLRQTSGMPVRWRLVVLHFPRQRWRRLKSSTLQNHQYHRPQICSLSTAQRCPWQINGRNRSAQVQRAQNTFPCPD